MPSRLMLAVLLCLIPYQMGAPGCGTVTPTPLLSIDTPLEGTFTNDGTLLVTGHARRGGGLIATLTVNGIDLLPLTGPNPQDSDWSVLVPLDPNLIFNPVLAEMTLSGGTVLRDRITVIVGDGVTSGFVLDGDKSPSSIAMRLNDGGLDEVEPVINSLVDLDLPTLLPVGTQVINEYCYSSIFGACIGSADAFIESNVSPPSPSISGFGIDIDSQTNHVDGDITLNDLFVRARVEDGDDGIGFTCHVNITATVSNIAGNYGLDPDAGDPTLIDVSQQGGVVVTFGNFNDSTDCDGIFGFVVEGFISLFVGSFEDLMEGAFEGFLNTPDAFGNTPVAGAIETALEDVDIAGPIGDALGATLETQLFTVLEDVDGITLGSDGAFIADPVLAGTCFDDGTGQEMPGPIACSAEAPCAEGESCRAGPGQCVAAADHPDYPASYDVAETFPVFGPLTPGSLPYDMGLCVSTSSFNQLLKAQLECGLLNFSATELPGIGTLTGAILAAIIPEIAMFPLSTEYRLDIQANTSAIITGNPGPNGELAELRVHGLGAQLVDVAGELPTLLDLRVDARIGLDASFTAGSLAFTLGAPDPVDDIDITVLLNRLGADELALGNVIGALFALATPTLSDALGTFPLPEFLGLQLADVEVGRAGEFLSLYLDLSAAP